MYVETENLLKEVAQCVYTIVDSNVKYEPTIGTTWVRATFMPGRSTTMSLGAEHCSEYSGLYRLDVFIDRGQPMTVANEIADKFIAAYKNKPMLEVKDYNQYDDSVWVYTGEVWRETARFEPVWVNVPVYVSWRTHYSHREQ